MLLKRDSHVDTDVTKSHKEQHSCGKWKFV